MNALRNIHEALAIGGLLIDTPPGSRRPRVGAGARELGRLDVSDWAGTIDQIDRLTEQTTRAGLFRVTREDGFTVTDQFPTGAELVAEVRGWAGDTDRSDARSAHLRRTAAGSGAAGGQAPRLPCVTAVTTSSLNG